ncbi:TetR/AcrR family transcriptional regulator [Cellulophaga sp. 20_2_10]|uniref:TetR/AcrR family transcriptional regulator n=1 Tax=Cellulophaga sp. 20_2_10 TaxID=2942476 RepID=UPI00201B0601|nr:TetR/AcrR family transcriptional regulator [Cellulophaga sp. 20_2_10]MCL5244519.1 TetR/AcrR family transcriptional regulator [Cellulophaga sp. 20_2_10]
MKTLLSNIKIEIPTGIYLKDPESSTLGKKIIENSIILLEEIGFEEFNFKKLGAIIGSNESSIYRYFESKHKLLMYLTAWYWGWVEYQLVIETYSITDTTEKLKKAIEVVTKTTEQDNKYTHINEVLLNSIIINENSKVYYTKDVDEDNKEGFFMPYKRTIQRIADIILAYNPDYKFALSYASTMVEGSLHQHFIQQHFKSITNCNNITTPTDFFTDLTLKTVANAK